MKHLSTTLLLVICIFISFSCSNKKSEAAKCYHTKTDTVYGLVGPGTAMHSLELCKISPADTLWFAIDDSTDVKEANLVIGNRVEVIYKGCKDEKVAIKIVGDATYANAVGEWTMPDPIAPDKVMGVNIQVEGVASSINMATLVYKSWELTSDKDIIILHGESIGTGETFSFSDSARISKDDKTLTMFGTKVVYTKQ